MFAMFCCIVLRNWPHFSPQKTRSPCRTGTSHSLSNLKNQRLILPSIAVYIYLCQSLNANLKISGRDSCPLPPVCRSCSPCTSPLVSCVGLLITMIDIIIIMPASLSLSSATSPIHQHQHYHHHQSHHHHYEHIMVIGQLTRSSPDCWTVHRGSPRSLLHNRNLCKNFDFLSARGRW